MREAAREVVRRLQAAGFEAYWAGGCVRDLLLGSEPEDYDVATAARPDDVMPLFEASREVGKSFAVVQVLCGGEWIEVATFRSEGDYRDGRHPEHVEYADAPSDARRRDFTINALFMDPESGKILDFVGGRADLEKRVLRCVGDPGARLQEDALRLLRAVRFACRFDLEIEPGTRAALAANAPRLRLVAGERVGEEFVAILTGPAPRRAMELLSETGLLEQFAPEIVRLQGCMQSPRHHPEGDVWEHTLRMLALMRAEVPLGPEQRQTHSDKKVGDPDRRIEAALALGVLLHDIGKPDARREHEGEIVFHGHETVGQDIAEKLMRRLAVPVRTQDEVKMLIGQHMRFINVGNMRKSTLRRFVLQERFDALLELHRLDSLSSRGDLTSWEFCRREQAAIAAEGVPLRPLLSGRDLQALGYAPGPRMGEILRALLDAQLENAVSDRPAAEAWVREHYAPDAADSPDSDTPSDQPPGADH